MKITRGTFIIRKIIFSIFFTGIISCAINAQDIVSAEYFFDSDPGIGNGTTITVPVSGATVNFNSSISTSGLSAGRHYLFVRTKTSDGHWSLYEPRDFYIQESIVKAEYFFDTDPGLGNGQPLTITPGLAPFTLNTSVPTTGLRGGYHYLFVRTKNASGHWSLYEPSQFYIIKSIVAAEYFIDTDPGLGLATPLSVGTADEKVDFDASITTPMLSTGMHYIFVRTKDDAGVWSLYEPQSFEVDPELPVEWISFTELKEGNRVSLNWATASEENCLHFEVERMELDSTFEKIGRVECQGTGRDVQNYTYYDDVIIKDKCYYRIKQVDHDGQATYSTTIVISAEEHNAILKVYPNPGSSCFTIDVAGEKEEITEISVIDSKGSILHHYKDFSFPFTLGDDLAPGSYIVKVVKLSGVEYFKIIKN